MIILSAILDGDEGEGNCQDDRVVAKDEDHYGQAQQ
jgi:hypothetical protein